MPFYDCATVSTVYVFFSDGHWSLQVSVIMEMNMSTAVGGRGLQLLDASVHRGLPVDVAQHTFNVISSSTVPQTRLSYMLTDT